MIKGILYITHIQKTKHKKENNIESLISMIIPYPTQKNK